MKYSVLRASGFLAIIFIINAMSVVEASENPVNTLKTYLERTDCPIIGSSDSEDAVKYRWSNLVIVIRSLEKTGSFPFDSALRNIADFRGKDAYISLRDHFMLHSLRRISGDEIFCSVSDSLIKAHKTKDFDYQDILDRLKESVSKDKTVKLDKIWDSFLKDNGISRLILTTADLHLNHDEKDRLYVEIKICRDGSEIVMYDIPYVIKLMDGKEIIGNFDLTGKTVSFEVNVPTYAESITIDPNWDLFRYFPSGSSGVDGEKGDLSRVFFMLIVCKDEMCTMRKLD